MGNACTNAYEKVEFGSDDFNHDQDWNNVLEKLVSVEDDVVSPIPNNPCNGTPQDPPNSICNRRALI